MTETVRELYGMACPTCGSDRHLHVVIETDVHLTIDGTDATSDAHYWGDQSVCSCDKCRRRGFVADFLLEGKGVIIP